MYVLVFVYVLIIKFIALLSFSDTKNKQERTLLQ